jgi:CBS domain-containing protein
MGAILLEQALMELPWIVGYILGTPPWHSAAGRRHDMKVSDILRVKGNTLYTVTSDEPLTSAIDIMAEKDIGSLVVMDRGELVGMLTFREVIQAIVADQHVSGNKVVRSAMDDHPLTCTLETELDEVRRMMLERHARYMPVMDQRMLMGVISLYDVAKAVVDSQNFENRMLKAYIRDWPAADDEQPTAQL